MHEHAFILHPEIIQNYPEDCGSKDERADNALTRMNELKSQRGGFDRRLYGDRAGPLCTADCADRGAGRTQYSRLLLIREGAELRGGPSVPG